ncbi:TonB-dependent receptor [Lutimonas zeaxanthinifaciens]|uniref:TonB-dependent receptor n=1 Tax=Lutimonas zeaxanthinifaciens TaxID=3060215 RepID=UPI00265CC5D7|nr:TonB-dependent receptor [Lutimonas sp. YSD2104]WKK66136.1 TonB-dependent receptor [Lutimonas sp. YSD2104]
MKQLTVIFMMCLSTVLMAQEKSILKDTIDLDEVLVKATRVDEKAPFVRSNVSKEEIESRNLGQDIPVLLNFLPNVVSTSDAGNGIGYTGIRVRGSDATRVNVTINGIPLNDSESHGVFWVNLPDFATSTQSMQLQRGVGSSTNGAGAFGASLSLSTNGIRDDSYGEVGFSGGSYNTLKANVQFGSGIIGAEGKWQSEFTGRVSTIQSDGYIDRATSDLRSIYLSASFFNENTLVKAIAFGGHEITYQAWYGIDQETLETNRKYNPAGEIYDENGELVGFYDNQVDNYKQDHYQLHINHDFGNNWTGNLAFHYTYGRGFYEQYENDADFSVYGFDPINVDGEEISSTDLVQRKWLDNDFYGTTFSVLKNFENVNVIIGGAFNQYDGDHFGEVKWAKYGSEMINQRFYDNTGKKSDFNMYAKADYTLNDSWSLFGDLQYRYVDYTVEGIDEGPVGISINDQNNFFNPKFGVSYFLDRSNFFLSYAKGNKEPKRADYLANPDVKPESLDDFELGWNYDADNFRLRTNIYYMNYIDQLVLTGNIDDVGNPIADNIGKSYRLGLEVDAVFRINEKLTWQPNLALSTNKNIDKYYEFDGELVNFGNTELSFSPSVIAGSNIRFEPFENLQFSLLSKYVGEQYMSNIELEDSKLDAYFVNDFQMSYEISTNKLFKSIVFSGLVNNLFNVKYVSNGYFYTYDDTWSDPDKVTTLTGAGYYPQAEINFLLGVNLRF